MDGASGGPRSGAKLVAPARDLQALLTAGLLDQGAYDVAFAALRAAAAEFAAAPRARSSVGDAGSPLPTSAGAAAALGARTTAVQQPAAGIAPPPLVRARAAAAPAELARKERGAEERSEAAAEAALRVLKPPAKRKAAEAGCRSILSMPGFSKSVVSGGVTYVVQPPALNFGQLKCSHPRCARRHPRSARRHCARSASPTCTWNTLETND